MKGSDVGGVLSKVVVVTGETQLPMNEEHIKDAERYLASIGNCISLVCREVR